MVKTDPNKDAAFEVTRRLQDQGYTAYWAGGCVRDMLMQRTPKDFDVATSALPDEVEALFEHTHDLGKAFGVIQVMVGTIPIEVATFRKDGGYQDHRHPDSVDYCGPKKDALRRDFTINGIFWDPVTETLHDFVQGEADIANQTIRAIGDPQARFNEDALRMLRAVRFASVLGFDIDPPTLTAIQTHAATIHQVSAERIFQELVRLFTESPQAGRGLELLHHSGLMQEVLPEIVPTIGQKQPPQFHPEGDVFVHTVAMLNAMNDPSPALAFSVLFHDVGKPPTATDSVEADGSIRIRFNGHASVGAKMAEQIMLRLKSSNHEREEVVHCVANHMKFADVPHMKDSTLKKWVSNPFFDTELELHRLDCMGSHGLLDHYEQAKAFREAMGEEPVLPVPIITGRQLMELGIPEGPEIGKWKTATFDMQLNHPSWTESQLLSWLEQERNP